MAAKEHEKIMTKVFHLARLGTGYVSPNPLVGAIVVDNLGNTLSSGYHKKIGGPHAEAAAVADAESRGVSLKGASLYCNLEPCCTMYKGKKTPPCTEAIIQAGISRVYISNLDPNPHVNGKGVQCLRDHGIEVITGILEDEGAQLNEAFFTSVSKNRPFIHIKAAMSLDGRIATSRGDSKWITDSDARTKAHQMRAERDAILVGRNTVINDDPSLTVRLTEGRNPHRVVLDSRLVLPENAKILDKKDEQVFVFTSGLVEEDKKERLQKRGIHIFDVPGDDGRIDIPGLVDLLHKNNINSLLIEGGGEIITQFIKAGLFDKVSLFFAPILIGKGTPFLGDLNTSTIKEALRLKNMEFSRIGSQMLIEGYREE